MDSSIELTASPNSELSKQVTMIGLTKRDLSYVKAMKAIMEQQMDHIIETFYSSIKMQPGLRHIIEANSFVDRLKQTLRSHIEELFDGRINESFLQKRFRIAHDHVRIGLQTKWYMPAFQNLLNSMTDMISAQSWTAEEKVAAIGTVTKLLNLEQQIVFEAYKNENERLRQEYLAQKEKLTKQVYAVSQELAATSEETSASIKELAQQSDSITQITKDGKVQANPSENHSL
ncbi:protoglobin domain-containing protein [Domibacillus iocasae]|uniref:protoglobin domain-containing protein n=1 Tax=Domibacillus iocasae TaxID=1714016 RepID=UPI0009F7110D|nr:protoglobin domain-containing protein [Domibacillus iocasae]